MKCHHNTIPDELAVTPHNLPPEQLRQITEALGDKRRNPVARLVSAVLAPSDRLACAACHREHHGEAFDLTTIGNAACQACHQQQYESFAKDHPDFGMWPYERRTRIVFNHVSHHTKHFAEKKQAFNCQACHTEDATSTMQLTASYEATCASCHDEKIATSVAQGVPMIVLPTLDVDALAAAGHDIGDWPEQASGDFDGRLPPVMKLLLAADPAAAKAISTLGEDFDFLDVDPDDPQHLAACATLATEIKQLLAELEESGPATMRSRLATALGCEISNADGNALVAGLSADTLRGVAAMWVPGAVRSDSAPIDKLSLGNAAQDSIGGSIIGSNAEPATPNPEPAYAAAGHWFRDDTTFSIRYRPTAHADPVLTSWLKITTTAPDVARKSLALEAIQELTGPTAAGLCATCHSVEQMPTGQLVINWRANNRSTAPRMFTKFSHGPHLVLPQLADCKQCHAIDSRAAVSDSYAGWDSRRFASEFLPISKHMCATCHTSTAAGDQCQSCHNYHVDLD
jgi:hypothetical protein